MVHAVTHGPPGAREIMVTADRAANRRPTSDGPPNKPQGDERSPREERILDVAAALLVRWGYRKTTVDDVAREAGVGKGTIYLHWKDKNELFRATIWRASARVTADVLRRLADDPEGGQFHRLWTHGILAILADPLMAALMQGRQDIYQGLMDGLDPETVRRLVGNAEEHIAQLQRAGLIRSDVSVHTITYLMSALKLGLIHVSTSGAMGVDGAPSDEQLAEALSDLTRRWLEPEHLPADSAVGKQIVAEWLGEANEIGQQQP